ncbi:unnamed protein product [Oppiella nova]|uniref:Uncharacterized protein n=1 Tax=Oppiella nova TaxID=334625 RepID=A0A7R9QE44_9ACAR|nr:unnamed protein product [Oppiella nova]CAG2163979.1 unnamed protein product [Oppiella nova]
MFGHSTSKLRGKIVWITGASSGIGEALAYELAANGVKLAISGTNVSRLEEVKRNCISFNQLKEEDVKILSFNVKDYSQHQKQFNSVITHFKTLDILVSNAGKGQRAEFANIDIDVDKEMFEINVFGLINLSRIALRYFLQNNIKGHLVVTSSIAGKSGAPNSSSYSATKHALHGYFESARIETKSKGISVTMLCPGPVVSRIAENVLTDKKDNKYGSDEGNSAKKMRTNRCAHLMAVAIANHLDEVIHSFINK